MFQPNEQVAEILHNKLCRSSHEDQCGFYWESWLKPGSTRKYYLDKADHILKISTDLDVVKQIINAL